MINAAFWDRLALNAKAPRPFFHNKI